MDLRARKTLFATVLVFFALPVGAAPFPLKPDAHLTPGTLCKTPDSFRYVERIPYCKRDVTSQEKWSIIREYDSVLDFTVEQLNRGDFKIDHLIPLCAGGSNERENLWPQHKSVYVLTDAVEDDVCRLMERGDMLQEEAVSIIHRVKQDPSLGPANHKALLSRLEHRP